MTDTTPLICPTNPTVHDWNNGITCRSCTETRTAGEAIVSSLATRQGGDEESARHLLDTHRTDVTVETLRNAAQSLTHIHKNCGRGRDMCNACQVRADMLDVLTSLADVLDDKSNPTQTVTGRSCQ